MTNKQALKELTGKSIAYPTADSEEALKVALEALEKQIPKKKEYSSHHIAFCPVCGGSVWQNADESNYCFRCGQRLERR